MQYLATLDNGTKLYLQRRAVVATNAMIRTSGLGEFAPTPLRASDVESALRLITQHYGSAIGSTRDPLRA